MNREMKDTELKRQRDSDLYDVYMKGWDNHSFANWSQAADYVIKQSAPRFYVSPREVSLAIGKLQRGISLIALSSSSRRRIWQLIDNYEAYLAEHPDNKLSRERVLEILVDEPAPEFYLSWRSAREILRKEFLKRRKKKWYGQ